MESGGEDGIRSHAMGMRLHPLQRLDAQETQAGLHDGGGPGAEHETAGRYFSLSAQIRKERAQYYKELEAAQAGSLDATRWCVWFLAVSYTHLTLPTKRIV